MVRRLALVIALLSSAHALAQPSAAPPPYPAPPQIMPGQWMRLSLDDGRFVDGYITGGDAYHVFIQTQQGHFSILRAKIIAASPLGAPAPAPAPMPPPMPAPVYAPTPVAAPAAPVDKEAQKMAELRASGVIMFSLSYGITVIAAATKTDEDDTAKYGYIPFAGPMMWALREDEDDGGEDGWDYLAGFDCAIQLMGVATFIGGHFGMKKDTKTALVPMRGRDVSGLAVVGQW